MLGDLQTSLRFRDRRTRRYVLLGGGALLSAALAYRAYKSETVHSGKRYLSRLRAALQKYTDALATGGDVCSSLVQDLQLFLQSEGDDIPRSLRQLTKLIQSPEVVATTSSTVAAVYNGIAGPVSERSPQDITPQRGALDKVLDALLSDRGHSLVSVAVSMGAKNMVASYLETSQRLATQAGHSPHYQPEATDKLLTFLSTQSGQQLAVMSIAALASNGMRVYMDKSLEVNLYEDLFSSMAKPQHLEAVKQCVSIFARDVVGAYMQGGSNGVGSSHPAFADLPPAPTLTPLDSDGNEEGVLTPGGHTHVIEEVPETSTAADSLDGSPASVGAADSSTPEGVVNSARAAAWTRHDDLDSDSLLHVSRALEASVAKRPADKGIPYKQHQLVQSSKSKGAAAGGDGQSKEWISAVGKEWLNVVKDPAGREAMVGLVGTATREVVHGVASAASEQMNTNWFVVAVVCGAVMAWLLQMLLRAMGTLVMG